MKCPCNCETCMRLPSSNHLFSFSKEQLRVIHLQTEKHYAELEGDSAESVLDAINSFVPLNPEGDSVTDDLNESSGKIIAVEIIYVDMARDFQILGDSIIIGGKEFVGEAGCLESLHKLCEGP